MSSSSLISYLLFPLLILFYAQKTIGSIRSLFNIEHFLFVALGTLLLLTFVLGFSRILTISSVFLGRTLGRKRSGYKLVVKDLFELSRAKNRGEQFFQKKSGEIGDLFLKDALDLLEWAKNEVSVDELKSLLETRANTFHERYLREIKEFRSFMNLPLYLGVAAALLEMLTYGRGFMLSNVILPLLYGVFLRIYIFVPVSSQLEQLANEDYISRQIVVEGAVLLHKNKPSNYLEEKLNSFVLPNERYKHT